MKRFVDLMLALILSLPALLLCLPAAFIIWLEIRANPIFTQVRVGRGQEAFKIIKLRTMKIGTGDHASHNTSSNNILWSGKFIRKIKIDELPQILNVLIGNMSFVGPRPCLPSQLELIEARNQAGIFDLVPGITGPSQLAGLDMSQPIKLAQMDATYRGKWSIWRDLSLIFLTFAARGTGDAVTQVKKSGV